jgi:D-serine deaminase-like pyridoxal phosphate-dependent protein
VFSAGYGYESDKRQMIVNQEAHTKTWLVCLDIDMQPDRLRWRQREELCDAIKRGRSSAAELSSFDVKIHKAQIEMHLSMAEEFRYLAIPFFGMPLDLIVEAENPPKGTISSVQLGRLQSKMLEYLLTMYGPE